VFISLRFKVLFFYLLLALLPLALAGWSLITITQDELKSAVNDRLTDSTSQLVKDINSLYQNWLNDFMLLRNAIDTPNLGAAEKIALLQNGVTQIDAFLALQFVVEGFPPALMLKSSFSDQVNAAGVNVAQILPQVPLHPAVKEPFFHNTQALGFNNISVLPLVSALNNPISNAQAYLIIYVDVDKALNLLREHSFSKYGQVFLLNSQGEVLFNHYSAHTESETKTELFNAALDLLHNNVHAVTVGVFSAPEGHISLGAYAATSPLPWAVAVSIDKAEAYMTIARMRWRLLLWLGGGLLAAMTMAWWFARHITQPVLDIAAIAQRIGAGDLSARVDTHPTHDEISLLGQRINEMGRGLMALHAAGSGIFQYDMAQDKYFWDERSIEIFALPPTQRIYNYKDWLACIHPEDIAMVKQSIQTALLENGAFDVEYRLVPMTAKPQRYIRTQGFRVRRGDSSIISGLHSDISARKETEAELVRARERAEAANRAKSAFLANMSHELRTPLNAILGYAQILEQDARLHPDHRHNIEIMHRSGDYLLTLINDTLDLAKIEAGRFELFPAPCNLRSFFLGLVEIFAIRAKQKGVEFLYQEEGQLPEAVLCDDKRLRQTLLNLLGNAVKFTEKGHVILRTSYHEGILSMAVCDSGIGIGDDQIQYIFEPFSQAGSSDYKMQGTGLGLSITRKLIQLMGGELTVKSVLGQGSTFSIHLPALEATVTDKDLPIHEHMQINGYQRLDNNSAPLRLLIADDVVENRDILVHLLQPLGFEVTQACDGLECLELAQSTQPDALLIDIVMPKMSGLEVTRSLRALPEYATTAIIALSASVFAEDRTHSIQAGCNEHLPKPFKSCVLFNALQTHLPLSWTYVARSPHEEIPHDTEDTLPANDIVYLIERTKRGDIKGIREHLLHLEKQGISLTTVSKLNTLIKHFKLKELRILLESLSALGTHNS
jgi:signal transduction histidine kinase/DNA-binding response OmpR family regulator/HAMP domain-containing protein